MLKNQDGKTYAELGFFNAEKFPAFLMVASMADDKIANSLLKDIDGLWKIPASLMGYFLALTDEENPPTHPYTPEELKSCTDFTLAYQYLSYRKLFDMLGIHDSRIINLDAEIYEVEGFMSDRLNHTVCIVLSNITGTSPDDRLLDCTEIITGQPPSAIHAYDYVKLDMTNCDHLTLMAVAQMAISAILRLSAYYE
ncbi:MAG: hypothetical protein ACI4T5_11460 [Prevotella sp.]